MSWLFYPGGQSLNLDLGNHDNCKGKCSGQTHKQTNNYFINIDALAKWIVKKKVWFAPETDIDIDYLITLQ